MGAANNKPNINVAQYQADFKATSQDCQVEPKQDRSCQDICCLVTFIILTLIFVIGGIYFIATINPAHIQDLQNSWTNSTTTLNTNQKHQVFYPTKKPRHQAVGMASGIAVQQFPNIASAIPYICLMGLLSLVLSVVLVIAISKIPQYVIYGTIILTFILIVVGIIAGVVLGALPLALVCGIFGIIWTILIAVMFCCWRQQFQAAIILLKVTGNFLRQKPSVLLAPLFVMFVSIFYFAFWFATFIAIQFHRSPQSLNASTTISATGQPQYHFAAEDGFSILWLFFSIFYAYFFYYIMVFLIATATALWYFNIEGNFIIKGLKNICTAHIGSFTFASMLVAIISMLKSAADNNGNDQNGCAVVCLCIVKCCLSFIQQLIKVLNHNSIIAMSVTGQDFIGSAKTAIYLIYNYFGVFVSVEMVDLLINVSVFFMTIVLPTCVGFLLLKLTYNQAEDEQTIYLVISSIIIFIVCIFASILTVTILSEALSCVFIFFCLNEQYRRFNYGSANNVPGQLRSLFLQIEQHGSQFGLNNQGNYNQGNDYNQQPQQRQNHYNSNRYKN